MKLRRILKTILGGCVLAFILPIVASADIDTPEQIVATLGSFCLLTLWVINDDRGSGGGSGGDGYDCGGCGDGGGGE